MSTQRIACSGPILDIAANVLRPFGEIVVAADSSEEALLEVLDGAVGLVLRGDGIGNARIIDAAPDLRVIGRSGVGFDNVDIRKANERYIPVIITPGANSQAVAEAALTYMLVFCKKVNYWDRQLKSGNWKCRFETSPGDLQGTCLGIVGFGAIGKKLAQLVAPFDMRVLTYDPYIDEKTAKSLGAKLVDLEEVLRQSDFVSLHTMLTEETRGMINQARINMMKPGSFLINMARGGVIESLDVLYDALTNGTLGGVALDVFDPEPPDVRHPLFKLDSCLTSPHAMGMTNQALNNSFEMMAEDMAAVLRGNKPRFMANPEIYE